MEKDHRYIRYIGRGLTAVFLSLVVTDIATLLMYVLTAGIAAAQKIDPFVILVFASVLSPLIFNSFALAFAYSDRDHIDEFLARDSKEVAFASEMKLFFSSRAIIGLITSTIAVIIFALLGAFTSFKMMSPSGTMLGNWLGAAILAPLALISQLLARYEAARYYKRLNRSGRLAEFAPRSWLVKRIIILSLMYICISPTVPFAGMVIISFGAIVAMMSEVLTIIGLVISVVLLVLIIWGIQVLSGITKRKRFLKRLRKIASDKGYTLGRIEYPYRAFATSRDQCSFTLTIDNERFDCIVISTLSKGRHLVFTSPSDAYFLHRIGTEKHNTSLHHNIEFMHTAGGRKIFVINPSPKAVFVEEDGEKRRISITDKVWGIPVYDADSFIGCADRKCL